MQTPANPTTRPIIAFEGIPPPAVDKPMRTIHSGKMAPMIAARPAGIYLTPHVLKALLNKKFKKLKIKIVLHSFPLGQGPPLYKKKRMKHNPPNICRSPP